MRRILVSGRFWLCVQLAVAVGLMAAHCPANCPAGTVCPPKLSDVPCPSGTQPGAWCEDQNECTEFDQCDANGICRGKPKDCTGPDLCISYGCDPEKQGGCTQAPKSCDDGNKCTSDSCKSDVGCVHTMTQVTCRRNCDSVQQDCDQPCDVNAGGEVKRFCEDHDGDGYYNPNNCSDSCVSAPGPGALKPATPAGWVREDSGKVDCNDYAPNTHPGAPELCSAENENCDPGGSGYDTILQPGTTERCQRCGFGGTRSVNSQCQWSECVIPPSNDFGPLPPVTDGAWGHQMPPTNCALVPCWAHPCDGDSRAWCSEGLSEMVAFGPYVTLPAGNYVVHWRGTHSTSSTWFDINDADTGQVVPSSSHQVVNGVAFSSRFDWDFSFTAEECHRYEFRVKATQAGSIHYGVHLERISISRQQ